MLERSGRELRSEKMSHTELTETTEMRKDDIVYGESERCRFPIGFKPSAETFCLSALSSSKGLRQTKKSFSLGPLSARAERA